MPGMSRITDIVVARERGLTPCKQPMTIPDLMNYLLYVEHSAENLQFYLWHQDYVKRFKQANTSDIALAPEWTKAMEEDVVAKLQKDATENVRPDVASPASEIFKGTDFEKKRGETATFAGDTGNPFSTPPSTARASINGDKASTYAPSTQVSNANSYRSQAGDAFAAAGAKTPCEFP